MSQASTISEIVPPDELSGLDNDETFIAGSIETSPDPDNRSSLPVTSTPHVLQVKYYICLFPVLNGHEASYIV